MANVVDSGSKPSCPGCGRVESQRRERSQDSRDESRRGVRGGMGRVIVEIVCTHGGFQYEFQARCPRIENTLGGKRGGRIYGIQMAV